MKKLAPLVLLGALANGVLAQNTPPQPGQLPSADAGAMKLPNTVVAPPFDFGDKFDYRIVQSFGLRGLGGSLIGAAFGQGLGSPYEWGGGVEGFAKRYGSGLASNLSRQGFAFALESALHEDPRYFPSLEKSRKARIVNALKQVITCKTDSGDSTFAYARIVSALGAGQLVNTWQPKSNNSVSDGLQRGVYSLGADFAYNLLQEFFPFTRPHSIRRHHAP
jgi:hypothetical protein